MTQKLKQILRLLVSILSLATCVACLIILNRPNHSLWSFMSYSVLILVFSYSFGTTLGDFIRALLPKNSTPAK